MTDTHWTDPEFTPAASGVEIFTPAELARWKLDPVAMARELFSFEPDLWQVEALRAWADPTKPRIALQACAGPGKSAVLALCGWNTLLCYSDGTDHPNGAATSMTGDNLKAGLWKELAKWYERAPRLRDMFEFTGTRIFERNHPKTWFLDARSFAKTADQEAQGRTLSGLHAKTIFYLCDESGSTPPAVGRAAEQGLGDTFAEFAKIAQAGNPVSHDSMLYESVTTQSHLWHVITITADPDAENRTPRKSKEWAREQISLHGRDNPWVMAFILGLFPPSSINALLGPDEVRAAMGRHLTIDQYQHSQKRLGIDAARFGDDASVIFPRQGLAARKPVEMRNARTDQIAARVIQAKQKWGSELELIDGTGGWGAGVVDAARLAGVNILEVNFGGKADDNRYFNKRSEMLFRAAEWVKSGGALPNIPGLIREATAATYTFQNGKFRVEEKAQIKVRLGKSPDLWDAFCCTFALVDLPSSDGALAGLPGQTHHAVTEWDPYRSDA